MLQKLLVAGAILWLLLLSTEAWRAIYHRIPIRIVGLAILASLWVISWQLIRRLESP